MSKVYTFLLTLFLVFSFSACSSDDDSQKHVYDEADTLSGNEELFKQYNDFNNALLEDFDIDFRVITTNSKEDINLFANKRFSKLETKSKTGKTILLVINPTQDTTRIEISMGLEPIYTDAFVSYIERVGMVPYFRNSKVADGIYMMSELIRDRATEAYAGKEFMPPMANKSIGGGAKTKANIGEVNLNAKAGANVNSSVKDSPKDVLSKYFAALKKHNKNPNLDIYTKDTQKFFKKWTVTDINQNHELELTSRCKKGKFYYTKDGYAVWLHPLSPRTCAPYFFKVEDNAWKLDIATMAKVIRFNKDMAWHFDMKEKEKLMGDYEFSFMHFNFDKNGFPYYKQSKKLKWGFTCSPWYWVGEPDKIKCQITWLSDTGKAKNSLGFAMYDNVVGLGYGENKNNNPSLDEVMTYMKNIKTNEKVVVTVYRDKKIKLLQTLGH